MVSTVSSATHRRYAIKQNKQEIVADYALRLEQNMHRYMLETGAVSLYDIDKQKIDSFIRGLKSDHIRQTLLLNRKSMENFLQFYEVALQIESFENYFKIRNLKMHNFSSTNSSGIIVCQFCNNNGHTEIECRKKRKYEKNREKKAVRSRNNYGSNNGRFAGPRYSEYC